ncbi:MAG: SixA phosphatase family protein [Granulosicoccaceae bacterium]
MKDLLLFRHAQAGGGSVTGRDFDRVLTEFGRSQPEGAGRALVEQGASPQLVLCSASARTRETLALLQASGLCDGAELRYSEALYECTVRQILLELAGVDDAIERVMLVGHNPGLSDLATGLTRHSVGLSPGDYAWLRFEGEWASVEAQAAQLYLRS